MFYIAVEPKGRAPIVRQYRSRARADRAWCRLLAERRYSGRYTYWHAENVHGKLVARTIEQADLMAKYIWDQATLELPEPKVRN